VSGWPGGPRNCGSAFVAVLATASILFGWATQTTYAAAPSMTVPAPARDLSRWIPDPSILGRPHGIIPHVRQGQKPVRTTAPAGFANPNCGGCSPPLLFTRGAPVMGGVSGTPGHVTITPVYWAPPGYTYTATYKGIVNGYIKNVALASQTSTNVFSVSTQYYQQASSLGATKEHIEYVVQAGTEVDDPTVFPPQGGVTGCTAAATYTACVTDGQLQTELRAVLTTLTRPIDDAHLYMVLFPASVETCLSPGSASKGTICSSNAYCGYHSATTIGNLVYSNEPFPVLNGCSDPFNGAQAPNGDAEADDEVSILSHEANEAITDWAGAWFDRQGFEIGDECAYVYGTPLGSTGGANTLYNQVVGTGKYYTQDEFSNEDFALGRGDLTHAGGSKVVGCLQQDELPTASFTGPSSVATGVSATFDGTASSDSDNATPLAYSWSWGDGTPNDTGASPSHVFSSAGTHTVTLTVTDVDGWSGIVSHPVIVTAPFYHPLSPVRVLDTRTSGQTIGPGGSMDLALLGGSVPSNATAVVMNMTATNTTANGFLTVYPKGPSRPLASNLNWVARQTVANLVMVQLGTGGIVTIYNGAGFTDAIADLEGYYAPSSGGTDGGLVPLNPSRITDTRRGSGQPNSGSRLGPGGTLDVQVTGAGGVPGPTGAEAVVLNVTVTNASAGSFFTVYPTGSIRPLASNLNWIAGQTVANRVVAPIGSGGKVSIYNQAGTADVIVDVNGYFTDATLSGKGFFGLTPSRILDTRDGTGGLNRKLGPAQTAVITIAGQGGVPLMTAAQPPVAVVINVTATGPTAVGFLTLFPDQTSRPNASDLNFKAGQTVPNLVVVAIGANGDVALYNAAGSTDVVLDVVGWYGDSP